MRSCKCFHVRTGRSEYSQMLKPAIKMTFFENEDEEVQSSKSISGKKMVLNDNQKDDEALMKNKRKPWSITAFEIGPLLGNGRYGKVFSARMKDCHSVVALKILLKIEIWDMRRQVRRGIEIQRRLRHPNILRILECFEDDQNVFLVLEYAEKDTLYKLLQKLIVLDEMTAAKCLKGLTKALIYCHSNNVIHRDIKPENLLVTRNSEVKLCGFGWSERTPSSPSTAFARAIEYLPPEMIKGVSYDKSVDIWSVGVLLYELLVGLPPFDATDDEVYRKIRNLQIKYPNFVPENARDLIAKLLVVKPEGRLPLKNVLEHPWVLESLAWAAVPPLFTDEKATLVSAFKNK